MNNSSSNIHTTECPVCGSQDLKPLLTCKDHLASQERFALEKCLSCGFTFTQDFPAEASIGRYYEAPEYISHTDIETGLINKLYHWARKISLQSKSKLITKYTGKNTGTLLDVGAGTGYFLNQMKCLKWVVTGIEKSEAARKYAHLKFGLNCQQSEYLYDVADKAKDVITMWHVLEHVEKLNLVMQRLYTILKDDGTAFIALPNKDSYDAKHYKELWAAYDVPRHLWHFSPNDFRLLAQKHNFEIIATKPMHFDTFYISMLSEQNKKAVLATFTGLVRGGFFFLRSLFNKERSSSVIYIMKKKQP